MKIYKKIGIIFLIIIIIIISISIYLTYFISYPEKGPGNFRVYGVKLKIWGLDSINGNCLILKESNFLNFNEIYLNYCFNVKYIQENNNDSISGKLKNRRHGECSNEKILLFNTSIIDCNNKEVVISEKLGLPDTTKRYKVIEKKTGIALRNICREYKYNGILDYYNIKDFIEKFNNCYYKATPAHLENYGIILHLDDKIQSQKEYKFKVRILFDSGFEISDSCKIYIK